MASIKEIRVSYGVSFQEVDKNGRVIPDSMWHKPDVGVTVTVDEDEDFREVVERAFESISDVINDKIKEIDEQ